MAATVWNFGALTPLAQISDRTGFLLAAENEAQRIVDTDATWQVEQDKGLQALPTPPEISRFYYVAEPVERIDGGLYDWSWNNSSSSHGSWQKAVSLGNAIERGAVLQNINWELVRDPLPLMQMQLTPVGHVVRSSGVEASANFPNGPLEIPPNTKATLLLDQSHLTTAYPEGQGSVRSAWGRFFGQQIDNRYRAFADPRADGQLLGVQAGLDLWRGGLIPGHRDVIGAYFAYGNGDLGVNGLVTNLAATAYELRRTGSVNLHAYSGGGFTVVKCSFRT